MTNLTRLAMPWTASSTADTALPTPRLTFLGVVRGEFFKLARQRLNWVMAAGITALMVLPFLYAVSYNGASHANHTQILQALTIPPQFGLFNVMGIALAFQRALIGLIVLVATARMVGLDYQNGTIRVLLARGVGRLQLLGAKLTVMALVGLGLLAWTLLLSGIEIVLLVWDVAGNLAPIHALTPAFWVSTRVDVLVVLVSVGISILLAAGITVVTRSLSFGLAGALGWFAADNVVVVLLGTIYNISNNAFWAKLTGYLLGPQLNVMPSVVVPPLPVTGTIQGHTVHGMITALNLGITPLVNYDGTHALVLALVYAAIFAIAAVVLTWRRDVLD